MKKILMLALLFAGLTASAQDGRMQTLAERENLSSEQRLENQLNTYTTELNLDAKQREAVKQILANRNSRLETQKAAMQSKDMTADQRQKMSAELNGDNQMENAELKKVLTADQIAQWEKRKAERAEKMKSAKQSQQSK